MQTYARLTEKEIILMDQILIEVEKEISRLAPTHLLEYYSIKSKTEFNSRIEVIIKYFSLCEEMKIQVIGEMDTFKEAACMAIAIKNVPLIYSSVSNKDARCAVALLNCRVATEMAFKMSENPIWNCGPNHDQPVELGTVSFGDDFKESKDKFLEALLYGDNNNPNLMGFGLETIYGIAKQFGTSRPENPDNEGSVLQKKVN